MKIAIIGAGFAGISTARVLTELGHEVLVYDKAPDLGGVWSATRRYPGLKTQNNKGTYALSEMPMPKDYPEWPSGAQVQSYLQQYAMKFDLVPVLRLDTEITRAEPTPGGGWSITTDKGSDHVDHLVLASGIFSRPFVPPIENFDLFEKLGGQVLAASEWHSLEQVRDKNTIVLGYGKSACDITVEIARVAKSTTVVARELLWKMPRKIKGVINYKYVMLTRMGEGLFRYRALSGPEKVLHAKDSAVANSMLGSMEKVTTGQLGLEKLGLVPQGQFSDIARSTVSLATEGFFEGVADGSIDVHRDTVVQRFVERDGTPFAELSNGGVIPVDVVVAATGWSQELPFLPDTVMDKLTDENGDYLLHKQIHPIDVPDLSFAGYNSSFFSPLSAEVSAIWIASYLGGNHALPSREEMHRTVRERLAWMRERTRGQHARGTNIIPFSVHNLDEVLEDLGLNVGAATRAKQWLMPLDPSDYAWILPKLKQRIEAKQLQAVGS